MRNRPLRRLTPKSHYNASIVLYEILRGNKPDYITWDIPADHIKMLELFIIEGKSATEIGEMKFLISKRKTFMSSDMISIWLKKYLPEMEFEKRRFHCKRGHDIEEQRHFYRIRKLMPKTPCAICGSTENLELDHIVPSFYGGKTELSNLQWLCYDCHKKKTKEEFNWL